VAVHHLKSNTNTDWTGTVTVGNSTGGTATIAATDLVRPVDWNSYHGQDITISGGATAGTSAGSGTNLVYGGSNSLTINLSTSNDGGQTLWLQPAMSQLTWGPGLSMSSNGSTITIQQPHSSEFRAYDEAINQAVQYGQSSMHVWPVRIDNNVTCQYIGIPLIYSNASNSSNSHTLSLTFALYTRNSNSFGSIHSTSYTTAMSASGSVGTNGAAFQGNRELRLAWSTSISGGRYYQALLSKSASNAGGCSISNVGASNWASAYSGPFGVGSNATQQWFEAAGMFSAQTAALPATFQASDLVGSTSAQQRPQIWRLMWNTY
jgi:hypothetical protein